MASRRRNRRCGNLALGQGIKTGEKKELWSSDNSDASQLVFFVVISLQNRASLEHLAFRMNIYSFERYMSSTAWQSPGCESLKCMSKNLDRVRQFSHRYSASPGTLLPRMSIYPSDKEKAKLSVDIDGEIDRRIDVTCA